MKVLTFFFCIVILVGCAGPSAWSASTHEKMMLVCSSACEESKAVMSSYTTLTGSCKCQRRRN